MNDSILINFGSEIKSLPDGRIEGYLVRFGSADDTDLVGDYFTKSTDFMIAEGARSPIYYNHGLDKTLGKRVIGSGSMKTDEVGVWFSGQLEARDAYEQAVIRLVETKKAGFSSGTASHLTERQEVVSASGKKSYEVTRWPLGLDASVTVQPCESKGTQVSGLKSFQEGLAEQDMLDISELNSEIKAITPSVQNTTLVDEIDAALAAVEAVTARACSANDLRIKSGRVLSATTRAKLQSMQGALSDLLASTEPVAPAADEVDAPTASMSISAQLSAYMDNELHLSTLLNL